jgi:hypothetical protein
VVWEGPVTRVTAADILGPPPKEKGPREGSQTAVATEWLRNLLAGDVAVKATKAEREMLAAGFSKKVIELAKKWAGVQSERISIGNTGKGYSMWTIE